MSTTATRRSSQIHLTHDETERAFGLAPKSNTGNNVGRPSLSLLMKETIEIGELARGLAPGELPWSAVKSLIRAAVERKAPRRVRA